MPRKDTREIRALLEEVLTSEIQNPELYAHLLSSLGVTGDRKPTYAELLVIQLVQKGVEGDLSAIREVLDRLLGKPVQHNQHVTATLSYQDFLMSLVDDREKKELGIIDVKAEPGGAGFPPKTKALSKKALPAPRTTPDPMDDLL